MKTIVALYEDLRHARRGIEALHAEDVPDDRVSLIARAREAEQGAEEAPRGWFEPRNAADDDDADDSDPADDAEVGAATGVGSLVFGEELIPIPAIGPVLATGPLGAAITAAATEAAAPAGLLPSLIAAGVSEPDARSYEQALHDGGALVMATVSDRQLERAVRALARCEPIGMRGIA